MLFSRGLAALILAVTFFSPLHAEFLYKDDVVKNPNFKDQIESIGKELKAKTGVTLYLVMVRDLENNESISDYEKRISAESNDSVVIMTFVELQKEVDILARPASLYKDFNKAQILSPNATFVGAMVSSVMFARSWNDAKELLSNSGGTVLPILAERAKGDEIISKYSVAMYNGYADVAEQIAASHGQTLSSSAGSGSQIFIDIIRLIFYGTILYALGIYFWRRFFKKREQK
ncbi:MAG: 3-dehydroquinate dehydratase [Sulfuricurvum sp.]|uniref:3-dehydroquinate dehydratase n=1 Tax=Sulfuricurvum sp. TaxID=2025608 RepID=UPI00260D215D|nr:3-dehydroquinate dehydratase [Sulfuricurvum sp.]MDD2828023.1 3-dehydroquinate dehydratase [Sulfuricurvum sp.]MDD4948100.1 3-dehydroquinate dehydratase [Sulfuricurvum sp.]